MAVPKRKTPRPRPGPGGRQPGGQSPARSLVPHCHQTKLPHIVCSNCGWYGGPPGRRGRVTSATGGNVALKVAEAGGATAPATGPAVTAPARRAPWCGRRHGRRPGARRVVAVPCCRPRRDPRCSWSGRRRWWRRSSTGSTPAPWPPRWSSPRRRGGGHGRRPGQECAPEEGLVAGALRRGGARRASRRHGQRRQTGRRWPAPCSGWVASGDRPAGHRDTDSGPAGHPTLLLDVGATVDCAPEWLVQFAGWAPSTPASTTDRSGPDRVSCRSVRDGQGRRDAQAHLRPAVQAAGGSSARRGSDLTARPGRRRRDRRVSPATWPSDVEGGCGRSCGSPARRSACRSRRPGRRGPWSRSRSGGGPSTIPMHLVVRPARHRRRLRDLPRSRNARNIDTAIRLAAECTEAGICSA